MSSINPPDRATEVTGEPLFLCDANSGEKSSPRPWLVFNRANGVVIIADDDETLNDPTARDFVLSKDNAIKLIMELLFYVRDGSPSTSESVSRDDVERALRLTP